MSLSRDVKFPLLKGPKKQRPSNGQDSVQTPDEGQGCSVSLLTCSGRKLQWTGSSYMYARPPRKPQLLTQLEKYVNKELQGISPHEPQCQELKLQVYRNVFGCFISAFRTYQPLLSAIKKEYEDTLAHQQTLIEDLEPLRSCLKVMGEEHGQRREQHAEIETLKREKQQLEKDIVALKEKEKATQMVVCDKVDHLQSELSKLYLQFCEERDARKLLIWQLNDLTRGSATREHSADEDTSRGAAGNSFSHQLI